MYHKNRSYRRYQKERVVNKRLNLFETLNPDVPSTHSYFTESGRLSKRRPYGCCQNRHCFCCNWKRDRKRKGMGDLSVPNQRLNEIAHEALLDAHNHPYWWLLGYDYDPEWDLDAETLEIIYNNLHPQTKTDEELDWEWEGSKLLDENGRYEQPDIDPELEFSWWLATIDY